MKLVTSKSWLEPGLEQIYLRLLSVVRPKLELKSNLKKRKTEQTLGEVDGKLSLLDANG